MACLHLRDRFGLKIFMSGSENKRVQYCAPELFLQMFRRYTGFRIYGPRFCPGKVDHISEMTIYPKKLVLKSD